MTIPTVSSILSRKFSDDNKLIVLGCLSFLLLFCAYLTTIAPAASYTTLWLNDEMALIASAYRAYQGQIPSVDFFSVLGAMTFYPTALGFELNLNASNVLAFGQLSVAVLLLTAAVLVCYSRFSLLPSSIVILFLFFLIVAPTRMGGSPFDI